MQIGQSAAAAALTPQTARSDGANRTSSNANAAAEPARDGARFAAASAAAESEARVANARKRRDRDGSSGEEGSPGTDVIDEALAVLDRLAKIGNPHRDAGRRALEEHEKNPPAIAKPSQAIDADPGALFGAFLRRLAAALGRLSVLETLAIGEDKAALAKLASAAGPVRAAESWWRGRVAARGVADAQLQELKAILQAVASHAAGLLAIAQLSDERSRAMRSLMSEVEVLQRLIGTAIDARASSSGPEPLRARSEKFGSVLDRWTASVAEAEKSVKILRAIGEQLQTVSPGVTPASVGEMSAAEHFERLASALECFASDVEPAPVEPHLRSIDAVASAVRRVRCWAYLPREELEEWTRLDGMAALLQYRVGAAPSWVDRAQLAAIARDLTRAVRLAAHSLRLEQNIDYGPAAANA